MKPRIAVAPAVAPAVVLAVVLAVAAVVLAGCIPATHVRPELDPTPYREPARDAITFWGHACGYIDVGGFGIVTDPVFAGAYGIFHRRKIPAPLRDACDRVGVVLISHAHHDHLHPESLARFPPEAVVLCPGPAARYLGRAGLRVRVMRPGDKFPFPGGAIVAVPAHHPGGRYSLKARSDGRALGYVIRTAQATVYCSGDTEHFPGLAEIGREHRPAIALLNVSRHLRSPDALLAVAALGVPTVVPMHFGAYSRSNARRSARWRADLEAEMGAVVVPLKVGESLPLAGPAALRAGAGGGGPAAFRDQRGPGARRPRAALLSEARGIPNFAEIEPGLTRGGRPTEEGIGYLRAHGYRTVVSLRRDDSEGRKLAAAGIDYVEIPLSAGLLGADAPTEHQVREFLSVVRDPARRPAFIHCRRGKDRTGVMAAIYRIEACGWSAEEAVEEMRALGFNGIYRGLLRFVRAYPRRHSAPGA